MHYDSIYYGYVNLDFRCDNIITEFCIKKNAISPNEKLTDDVQKMDNSHDAVVEDKLYKIDTFNYAIEYKNKKDEVSYYMSNKKFNNKEFDSIQQENKEYDEQLNATQSKKYSSFAKIWQTIYSGSSIVKPTFIKQYSVSKSLLSEETVEKKTNKYACAVVALTEIARQEGISAGSIKKTFNSLWNKTNTSTEYKNNGISYGTTLDVKLSAGMKSYAKEQSVSCTCKTKSNPSASFFINAVKDNLSSTLSMRILKTDGTKSGHTVSVVGYCKSLYNEKIHTYVIVANGWYDNAPVYIDYNNVDFVDTYGVTYNIE